MIEIKLNAERDTPLSIADAIITREWDKAKDDCTVIIAKENVRQIGQALINFAEASDRVNKAIKEFYGSSVEVR